MLTIAWHLVVNGELYAEEGKEEKPITKYVSNVKIPLTYTIKEVIEVLVRAKEAMIMSVELMEGKKGDSPI